MNNFRVPLALAFALASTSFYQDGQMLRSGILAMVSVGFITMYYFKSVRGKK